MKEDSPDCNCCCVVLDDSFTRADSDDPGGDYEVVSGDWSIDTNRLKISDDDAILLTKTSIDDNINFSIKVAVDFDPRYSNFIFPFPAARIIFAYVDASNFWYLRFDNTATNNCNFELHKVEGGDDTNLTDDCFFKAKPGSQDTLPSPIVIRICKDDDTLYVTTSPSWNDDPWTGFTQDVTGEDLSGKIGLGTETLSDFFSTVHPLVVDQVVITKPEDDNEDCPPCQPAKQTCPQCKCQPGIKGWLVELEDFAGDPDVTAECGASDCERINGAYVVDQFPTNDPDTGEPSQCYALAFHSIQQPNAGVSCDEAHLDCAGTGAETALFEIVLTECINGFDPGGTFHVGRWLYAIVQLRLGHCGGFTDADQILMAWWTTLGGSGNPDDPPTVANCVQILAGALMNDFKEAPAYYFNAAGGCLVSNPTKPYKLSTGERICGFNGGAPKCRLWPILA